jgi:hypothetical protein
MVCLGVFFIWNMLKLVLLKGSPDVVERLLPCECEVSWIQVLEAPSCKNVGKGCVHKTQSGRTLLRTLCKWELYALGCPFMLKLVLLF